MQILQHPADKKIQNYQFSFKAKLGKGAYGTVYAGKNIHDSTYDEYLDETIVALKVIDKKLLQTDYANQLIASEIEIMKKIDNKNIVKLIDVLQSVNNTYIVTEYCNGGDLREYLKKKKQIPEHEAVEVFKELLTGIKALLAIGIIHRDIKPANILIHEGCFKITDFGFAKQVSSHMEAVMNSLVGTPLYMSPQILKRQKYTSKCDIWSLGLILYEMIYGITPWHSQNLVELMAKLESKVVQTLMKPLYFPSSVQVSESTKSIIRQCLQIPEEKRIGWTQLFEVMDIDKQIPQKKSQRTKSYLLYLDQNQFPRVKTDIETPQQIVTNESRNESSRPNGNARKRSNSQMNHMRFNTQKVELQQYLDNVHTPPLPAKKFSYNQSDSFRTPSGLQSHSTNTSNRQHYDKEVSEFQLDEQKSRQSKQLDFKVETEDESNRQGKISTTRIKRTNSLISNGQLSPLLIHSKKQNIQSLHKIMFNQYDLIPNHINLKQQLNKTLIAHQGLVQSSTIETIFTSSEQKEVKQIINKIIDYLNQNQGDHFTVQLQVMLLLLINYNKLIDSNIKSNSLKLSNNLLELMKQNQQIQQNQLHIDPKQLRDNINSQLS